MKNSHQNNDYDLIYIQKNDETIDSIDKFNISEKQKTNQELLFDELLYDHKERMFDWTVGMSSYYLIIVLLIFSLFMFEVKIEDSFWWIVLSFFIIIIFTPFLYLKYKTQIDGAMKKIVPDKDKIKKDSAYINYKILKITLVSSIVFLIYLFLNKIVILRSDIGNNSSIIIALITSTTGTIIALPSLVARAIFDNKK